MTSLEADEPGHATVDRRLLARLLQFLRPYRGLLALSLGLLLIQAGLSVVGPAMTQRALDGAIPEGDSRRLTIYAAIYLASIVATFGIQYVDTLLTTRIGQGVMYDLRLRIFAHLQRLSIAFFDRNPVGRLMTRVTADVEALNELFSSGVVAVFGDVFTLLAIAGMMVFIDWRLALVAFAVIPMLWVVISVVRRRIRQAFRDIRARVAQLNSFLQEHLAGMRVVQLFGLDASSRRTFDTINRGHLDAHRRSITVYAIFFPLVELVTAIALALLLYAGGRRIVGGTLTIGVLAAFVQLTRRFFTPLQDLAEKVNLLQGAMASSERIFRLLDTPVGPAETPGGRALLEPVRGAIAFENVWFRYSADGPWALRDVSFRVPAGGTIAIVGHTGAGKTTIMSLLLRFYEPEQGRITLDGVDIREVDIATLRAQFGFVQQDLFLFSGDVLRNLALDATTTDERVKTAADRVGVGEFIERLPGAYHHQLAERGRNLSVGERQLLSFARALARDPKILLLDEATSSVDSLTEARIEEGIAELMAGRTAIVIAHRLSTIQTADEILVLHRGEIVERGRHDQLLLEGGVYERLYRLQVASA